MSKSDSSPETARSRLAVLTAHLVGATTLESSSSSINRSCVSAQVSPPGNLRGALTVIDERTGKKYQIPVSQDGTVKASDFKKVYFYLFLNCCCWWWWWFHFQFNFLCARGNFGACRSRQERMTRGWSCTIQDIWIRHLFDRRFRI